MGRAPRRVPAQEFQQKPLHRIQQEVEPGDAARQASPPPEPEQEAAQGQIARSLEQLHGEERDVARRAERLGRTMPSGGSMGLP